MKEWSTPAWIIFLKLKLKLLGKVVFSDNDYLCFGGHIKSLQSLVNQMDRKGVECKIVDNVWQNFLNGLYSALFTYLKRIFMLKSFSDQLIKVEIID